MLWAPRELLLQMKYFEVWNSNFTREYAVSGSLIMTTEASVEWGTLVADLDSLRIERCSEIEQAVYGRWAGVSE